MIDALERRRLLAAAVSVADASVLEGGDGRRDLVFAVTLSEPSTQPVSVRFRAQGQTATPGRDYLTTAGLLTFAPGETSKTIPVGVLGDLVDEADHTFGLLLGRPSGATLERGRATGTIVDDDQAPVINIGSTQVVEGNTRNSTRRATFDVRLSNPSSQRVVVNYSTFDGSATAGEDFRARSGSLVFRPGQMVRRVSVPVLGDRVDEGAEAFSLRVTGATSATPGAAGIATIHDDEGFAALIATDASVMEGDDGFSYAEFGVLLTEVAARPVRVAYQTTLLSTDNGWGDFAGVSGLVNFAPGQTRQTVRVPVMGDTDGEANETFTFRLTDPDGAVLEREESMGTIIDDDRPPDVGVSVADATSVEGVAPGRARFVVNLTGPTDRAVTVRYTTVSGSAVAGSDYAGIQGDLVFAPGQTQGFIDVEIVDDSTAEETETFSLLLLSASNALVDDGLATGTIFDQDDPASAPVITVGDTSVTEGNAGSRPMTFALSLSKPWGQTITVNHQAVGVTATAGADFSVSGGTVTFEPGQTTAFVHVSVLGDTADEPNETLLLALTGPVNAVIGDVDGLGTIIDDDEPTPLAVTTAPVVVTEGNGPGVVPVVFNLSLNRPANVPVTVNYSTSPGNPGPSATAGADYTPATGSVTFAPGQTLKEVTVNVLGDTLDEADEVFTLNLSSSGAATSGANATIIDDDGSPAVSVLPTAVLEGNAGTRNLAFTVTLSAISGRPVTVSYATSDQTATAGSDYTATDGVLTIPAGQTTALINVPVSGDTGVEPDESLLLTLTSPAGATLGTASAQGFILNDESSFFITSTRVLESDQLATLVVYRTGDLSQAASVHFATLDDDSPTDYTPVSGTLNFASGQGFAAIDIIIADDTETGEADEYVLVRLSNAVNAALVVDTGVIEITEDSGGPRLTLTSAGVSEPGSGTTDVIMTVTLQNAPSGQLYQRMSLVSTATAVPGGTGTFQSLGLPVVGTTGIIVPGRQAGTPADGLYFLEWWLPNTLRAIVSHGALLPGDGTLGSVAGIGGGNAAVFSAYHQQETSGLYAWASNSGSLLYGAGQTAPGSGGATFAEFRGVASDLEHLAFTATLSDGSTGLFIKTSGGLVKLVRTGESVGPAGALTALYAPAVYDQQASYVGDYADAGGQISGRAIYHQVAGAAPTVLAASGQVLPGTDNAETYASLGTRVAMPFLDTAVYQATGSGGRAGIYRRTVGQPADVVVDTTVNAPGGGTFTAFDDGQFSASGLSTAFVAQVGARRGLFAFGFDQQLRSVVEVGQVVGGKTVAAVAISSDAMLGDIIAARLTYADGSQEIVGFALQPAAVHFRAVTVGATAIEGEDFEILDEDIILDADDPSQSITIRIRGGDGPEGTEHLRVVLIDPTSGAAIGPAGEIEITDGAGYGYGYGYGESFVAALILAEDDGEETDRPSLMQSLDASVEASDFELPRD